MLRRISSSSGFVALNTWRVTTKTRVAETIRCGRENVAATAERTRLAARQLADGTKSQAMALRKAEGSKTKQQERHRRKKRRMIHGHHSGKQTALEIDWTVLMVAIIAIIIDILSTSCPQEQSQCVCVCVFLAVFHIQYSCQMCCHAVS